jgi:DNA-binding Xre family transcriptional regulator
MQRAGAAAKLSRASLRQAASRLFVSAQRNGGGAMKACFDPLWKLLREKGMDKSSLISQAEVSPAELKCLEAGENVSMHLLLRLLSALECDLSDIVCLDGGAAFEREKN